MIVLKSPTSHGIIKLNQFMQGLTFRYSVITLFHDDVIKWKHFPRYWPFVRRIHRFPMNSPHKGQWRGTLNFFFDLRLNKRLSKQWWGWWFETLSHPSCRHSNEISHVVRTVKQWISGCAPILHCNINVMHECIIGKSSPHQPCENPCHSNVWVIVALNDKSASMLLVLTKNRPNQWLVMKKSVNKCNDFPDIRNCKNMNENNKVTNLWLSNSYI